MHELSVCQGLIKAVERIARDEHARSVSSLTVRIGVLSGVEPLLLARAFEIARAGTVAQGAVLHVESAPLRVACEDCGAQGEASPQRLLCPRCGAWRVRLVAGDELHLSRIEFERDDELAQHAGALSHGAVQMGE